jgi:hypothetical protein
MSSRLVVAGLLFALLAISGLGADERRQPGAVEQRGGPVSQDAKPPPLELTNAATRASPPGVAAQAQRSRFPAGRDEFGEGL